MLLAWVVSALWVLVIVVTVGVLLLLLHAPGAPWDRIRVITLGAFITSTIPAVAASVALVLLRRRRRGPSGA